MITRSRLIGFVLVVGVACLPMSVQGQCSVATTSPATVGMTITVLKILVNPGQCTLLGPGMNAACIPTPTGYGSTLFASATTGAPTPRSCVWTCSCTGVQGPITIDGNDGLPVELMDFGIEDESEDVGTEKESEPVEKEGRLGGG